LNHSGTSSKSRPKVKFIVQLLTVFEKLRVFPGGWRDVLTVHDTSERFDNSRVMNSNCHNYTGKTHIYLKLMIDGVTSRPFSAVTLLPPKKGESFKEDIILGSRQKFGR
jgi:hypothetical protein